MHKISKYSILIMGCILSLRSTSQIYFSNRYDTFGSCDGSSFIDTLNGEYLTANFTCSPVSFYALNLKLYNINGAVTKSKTYNWQNNNFANGNGFKKTSNRYLLSGTRFYKTDTSLVFQWIYDANLDSVKYTEYGYLNKGNIVNKIINYKSLNYYMVGQVYDNLYNSDVLLIKTDTAGNEIWKKKIGVAGWDESAYSIDTINDKLIIGGSKNVHSSSSSSGFVMLMDTSANIIWQKTVTTNGASASSAKKLKDGNILVYSAINLYTISSNKYSRLQCEKIDVNNTTLWQQQYNAPAIGAGPFTAIENTRGNIVIAGQIVTGSAPYPVNGIVNEIAQNGDSLFTRQYAIQPGSQNYFRDVIQAPAPDRGYCFAGFTTPIFANGGTGTQDIWLLKVDSNFCESNVSCGYPTSLYSYSLKDTEVRLYPNPTNNQITFMFGKEKQKNCTIDIYNANGQLVKNIGVAFDNESVSVEMQDLKDGIYFYRIYDSNSQLKAGKIVLIK